MRTSVPFLSLHEVPDDLADCDGSCCPGGGLCCPDDPLDAVMRYLPVVDDALLEALGIGGSPPRSGGRGHDDAVLEDALDAGACMVDAAASERGGVGEQDMRGLSRGVPEVHDEVVDVDMFFEGGAPDDGSCGGGDSNLCNSMSCHTPLTSALPAGGLDARGTVDGFVSDAALSARPLTTSSTSSGSLSSTTWETESPAPVSLPGAWVWPRKQRHQPVIRRNQSWLAKPRLDDVPDAPHDSPTSHKSGNDARIRRRSPEPRKRNRPAQRVCSHCHSSDTPQWRAGPRGRGTLCNACGIRYKNQRLLPEYRPSTSPSFRSGEHSNRHRKVVKLREQKAKEEILKMMADTVPAPPKNRGGGEFMDVCTYISTG
ncbi:uncharacterized protein LOC133886289 [Phragmites australis]|uniref:uncharacterized protein LOC133886289 n=1 Tax=Phragmites australis TaxID=29695 RepID=UPI002D78BAA7|nr:uncharacterized protein LOC133886289 [Phragmites australis]